MDSSMFKGFDTFLIVLVVFAVIGAIFGVWKIIELLIWFFKHIQWVS